VAASVRDQGELRIRPLSCRTFTEAELIARAIVDEVSLLSPGARPAEPCAQVVLLERQASPAALTPSARAAGEYRLRPGETVIYGNGQLLRRRYPTTITVR